MTTPLIYKNGTSIVPPVIAVRDDKKLRIFLTNTDYSDRRRMKLIEQLVEDKIRPCITRTYTRLMDDCMNNQLPYVPMIIIDANGITIDTGLADQPEYMDDLVKNIGIAVPIPAIA